MSQIIARLTVHYFTRMVAIKNISLQNWAIASLLNVRISHNNVDKTVGHTQLQTKPKTKKNARMVTFFSHKIVEIRMVAIKHISLQDGNIARLLLFLLFTIYWSYLSHRTKQSIMMTG